MSSSRGAARQTSATAPNVSDGKVAQPAAAGRRERLVQAKLSSGRLIHRL